MLEREKKDLVQEKEALAKDKEDLLKQKEELELEKERSRIIVKSVSQTLDISIVSFMPIIIGTVRSKST